MGNNAKDKNNCSPNVNPQVLHKTTLSSITTDTVLPASGHGLNNNHSRENSNESNDGTDKGCYNERTVRSIQSQHSQIPLSLQHQINHKTQNSSSNNPNSHRITLSNGGSTNCTGNSSPNINSTNNKKQFHSNQNSNDSNSNAVQNNNTSNY